MMEDNNKLFVFEKKEVLLIFVFIVLIAVISFTLGVRTGKQLSLKSDEYTAEDVSNINLKSIDEESVEQVVKDKESSGFEKSLEENEDVSGAPGDSTDVMEQRLKEEMEKLAKEKIPEVVGNEDTINAQETPSATPVKEVEEKPKIPDYSGKYTIQLFSHQSQESAQEFADAFIIKGYDVIINEVIIPGKGKWYRVGIGAFSTVNEAEDYLHKEKALFQSHKYIIQKI